MSDSFRPVYDLRLSWTIVAVPACPENTLKVPAKCQVIDLSLLEPIISILGPEAAAYTLTRATKPRVGSGYVNSSETPDASFWTIRVSTTVIYTHVLQRGGKGVRGPLDP